MYHRVCNLCLKSYLFGGVAGFCPDCIGSEVTPQRITELECQLIDVILLKEPRIAPGHA